jgi:hypothetical protein
MIEMKPVYVWLVLDKEGRLVGDEVFETEIQAIDHINDNPGQALQVRKKLRVNLFGSLITKVNQTKN